MCVRPACRWPPVLTRVSAGMCDGVAPAQGAPGGLHVARCQVASTVNGSRALPGSTPRSALSPCCSETPPDF